MTASVSPATDGPLIVIGLGNLILSDDAVGLIVVRELAQHLPSDANVVVEEDVHGGLRLMERMMGYRQAIIVDAICSGAPPGTIFELGLADIPTAHSASAHDASLPTALRVGRLAGAVLPTDEDIRFVAIEAEDVTHFGETLTPHVKVAVPIAVQRTLQLIHRRQPAASLSVAHRGMP